MRQVLTYRVPGDLTWKDSIFQKEYKDVLHIVATPTLLESLTEEEGENWWIKAPIVTIGSVLEILFGSEWSSPRAQLKQFLNVSAALEELWEEARNKDERRLLLSFKKNRQELLYTIRTLNELRLMDKLTGTTEEEVVLLKLWNKVQGSFKLEDWETDLEMEDKKFIEVLCNFFNEISDSPLTLEKHNIGNGNTAVEDVITESLKKKTLILHGFYFITPIQEYLFKILEKNYKLVFLNLYNENFPGTFRIVEEFLEKGIWEWKSSFTEAGCEVHPLAESLLLGFEGEEVKGKDKGVVVERFTDMADFIKNERFHSKESRKRSDYVITSRGGMAREQLYYSDILVKKNRSLLEYPIGRFLFTLHEITREKKNPDTGESKYYNAVSPHSMKSLFSSGYLTYRNPITSKVINLKSYLNDLEMLLPYFSLGDGYIEGREKDEPTIDEWVTKIDEIIQEKNSWPQLQTSSSRVHRLHSRPFEQLSYFKVDLESLESIKQGFLAIREMSQELFGNKPEMNITEYIKKLKKYTEAPLETEVIEEEKGIIESLVAQIDTLAQDDLTFRVSDISLGLQYFLTSGLPSEKNSEEEKIERLGGLFLGDGIPFKAHRDIHLAFADHKSLPSVVKYKLWPLSSATQESLMHIRSELKLFKKHAKLGGSMNRYLLYAMFSSANNIRISYVEDLNEEAGLELANYFKMIGMEEKWTSLSSNAEGNKMIGQEIETAMDFSDWSEMMEEEWNLCKKRATFSYILNDYSSFQEPFHQSHIFSKLLWGAHDVFGNWQEAYESIENLFPQYSTAYKNLIKNQLMKKKGGRYPIEYYDIDGYKYSEITRNLRFLKQLTKKRSEKDGNSFASPGYQCRFCPHLNLCTEGDYSIDDKKNKSI